MRIGKADRIRAVLLVPQRVVQILVIRFMHDIRDKKLRISAIFLQKVEAEHYDVKYLSLHMPRYVMFGNIKPNGAKIFNEWRTCTERYLQSERIWHYRVDLMSDVQILTDADGKAVPIDFCAFEALPICNACWDPEKYMAEHLYMAYDEPKEIRIKINNTDYTILHDWFGNHYEKTKQPCEAGYDIVNVRNSPFMIVQWAMQYASAVEVIGEEIRKEIREEIKKLKEKYC